LELRRQVRQNQLPETVMQLRGEALQLVLEKPDGWQGRLLFQILANEIGHLRNRRRDLEYGIPFGQGTNVSDIVELLRWMANKTHELNRLLLLFDHLINTVWWEALTQTANIEYIVHLAKRAAEFYRNVLEWTEEFKRIPPDEQYNSLVVKLIVAGIQTLSDIEKFTAKAQADIKAALLVSALEDVTINVRIVFSSWATAEFTEEFHRLWQHYGLN
jgi:hypothetical protein